MDSTRDGRQATRPPRPSVRPRDGAVSEVIATTLLALITIAMVGGFSLVVLSALEEPAEEHPVGAFLAAAEPNGSAVTLRFLSGTPFPLADALIVVSVDGSANVAGTHHLLGNSTERWSPGTAVQVNLTADAPPLANGTAITAHVVHRPTGALIGMTAATITSGASTLPLLLASTPSLGSVDALPATLTADGTSVATLTATADHSIGREFIATVEANLTSAGGEARVLLRDDGAGADAMAADGIYTAQFTAPTSALNASYAARTVTVPIRVTDVFGATATTSLTVTLGPPPPSKVAPGARYRDVPSSASAYSINLTNFSLRDPTVLANDQIELRVSDLVDGSRVWSALVTFGYGGACGTTGGAVSIVASIPGLAGTVTYTPTSGCIPLGAHSQVNLVNPEASLSGTGATTGWTVTGDPLLHGYAVAGVGERNEAVFTFFGDALVPGPLNFGISQADLTWGRVPNLAPTASFTTSLAGDTLAVNGGASSDPEGSALTYTWSWGDGTPTGTGATAGHVYASPGTYTVTLVVADSEGATGSTTASVRVNRAPTASFTATGTNLTASATGAASTDADGTIASYTWSWGDGTNTSTGVSATHTYASAGTYTITLTVTDNDGATASTTRSITMNRAPTASFTTGLSFLIASVNAASSSDPDGHTLTYTWNWGDGTPTGSGITASHAYALPGTYTITLTVTDTVGATNTTTDTITVGANNAPTARLTASAANLTVSVNGSSSNDPDGTIAAYAWSWGDGTAAGSGATASHTYAAAGAYTITLTVTDNNGATDSASTAVSVNRAPTASFTNMTSELNVTVNGAASSDPDGQALTYTWSWGDGTNTSTGVSAAHAYASAGTYTVTLTVTDTMGASATTTRTLNATSTRYTYFTCPLAAVTGTLTNCANMQAADSVYATLAEGTGNPKMADARFTGAGTAGGTSHTLELTARTSVGAETLYVQVSTNGGSTWTTLFNLSATTMATYSAPLTAAQFNNGAPLIRLADRNLVVGGTDGPRATWEIDYLRVVST